jgi:hypothetical protein
MSKGLKFLILVVGTVLFALFVSVMLMVIYPGSLKATASILCPDDRPDSFVVRYDVTTSDGTGTNFTLFCMSERGEFVEIGTWEPLGLLFVFVGAGMLGGVLAWGAVSLIRGSSRAGPEGPTGLPDQQDPFVAMTGDPTAPPSG